MRNDGKWTEGRYHAFIVNGLRGAYRRWPPKFEALGEAWVGYEKLGKTKRDIKVYECKKCRKPFPRKQVQVDHIKPVVPKSGFTSWDDYIERLFCEKGNLQILCKKCHKGKTAKDKK